MTTVLYWTICILGACTLTSGVFAIIDRIEQPRKRSKIGGVTRSSSSVGGVTRVR